MVLLGAPDQEQLFLQLKNLFHRQLSASEFSFTELTILERVLKAFLACPHAARRLASQRGRLDIRLRASIPIRGNSIRS